MIQHVYTRQVIHYERGLHKYTLIKSYITNENSTYTHHGMHYERGLHMHTLVNSCITNKDSTCIHSSIRALRTRTPHTLIMACIQNDDSTCIHSSIHALRTRTPHVYTRQIMHYERGLHMYMLSAICGSARSMDRAAQSVDFAYTTNHYTIAIPRGRRHILYGPIGNLY